MYIHIYIYIYIRVNDVLQQQYSHGRSYSYRREFAKHPLFWQVADTYREAGVNQCLSANIRVPALPPGFESASYPVIINARSARCQCVS